MSKDEGGATTIVAAGLLVLGFALVAVRLIPARAEASRTLADERMLTERVRAADAERKRLEALDRGLAGDGDPQVLERLLRERGAGRNGEERIQVETATRPAGK